MVVSEIELYEILSAKIGKQEAKVLTEFVEAKAEKQLIDKLSVFATKEDLFSTKEDLSKEISSLEVRLNNNISSLEVRLNNNISSLEVRLNNNISSLEVRLNRNIYIVGVVQFLAIVGSVMMLLKFHFA